MAAPVPDAESLRLGRKDCSGKESLPYQLIWGSFRKELGQHPPTKRTLLVQVSGEGKCRNCMFSVKDQLSVERMGLSHTVASRHFGNDEQVDARVVFKVWTGMTLWDLLNQLASYIRPLERSPGAVDALYAAFCDEVESWTERGLGRGPATALLVSESLLRSQKDIPLLFVYADGSPLDLRRLDAFAFRLKRRSARSAAPSGVAAMPAPARTRSDPGYPHHSGSAVGGSHRNSGTTPGCRPGSTPHSE